MHQWTARELWSGNVVDVKVVPLSGQWNAHTTQWSCYNALRAR